MEQFDEIRLQAQMLLSQLGLRAGKRSFHVTACAVALAVERPQRLWIVTKQLYPEVAARYRMSWQSVERNIRAAARTAWQENPGLLAQLAGGALLRCPAAAQFVALLAANCGASL